MPRHNMNHETMPDARHRRRKSCFFSMAAVLAVILLGACATDHRTQELAAMHLRSGIAAIESGQYTEALRELFEARQLRQNDPEIHYYLGIAYWSRGRPPDAFESFSRAVELKRDYSDAYNYMGLIRFEEGRYDEAASFFLKALDNVLYDTPEFAYFNLGRTYREGGSPEKALACFEEALKIRPNRIRPVIHENMGTLLLHLDRRDEALRHLQESVRLAPYVADFRYSLGRAYLAQGMGDRAARELRQAIELAPDSEAARRARALLSSESQP